jgi:hypothetical protein
MWKWLVKFDALDRRVIYVVLFILAALPFIVPIRLKPYVWKEVKAAYEVTDACPKDKVIAIDSDWDGGSQGENWPQYEAVVNHCMMRGIKFIVFSMDAAPQAQQMAENINIRLGKIYGREYGKDWVNLGLTRGAPLTMGAIGRNVKKVFSTDFYGTPTTDFKKLPLMKQVNTVRDFQALWSISYQPSLDWLVFLDTTGQLPIMFGSAGIVTTSWYPYISSGQMRGMMPGVRGAAEYIELIKADYGDQYVGKAELLWKEEVTETDKDGNKKVVTPGEAVILSRNGQKLADPDPEKLKNGWKHETFEERGPKLYVPLSFGYLLIITMVILGNLGMIARKRALGGKR